MIDRTGMLEGYADDPTTPWVVLTIAGSRYLMLRESSVPMSPEMVGQQARVRCILGSVVADLAVLMHPLRSPSVTDGS